MKWKVTAFNDIVLVVRSLTNLQCKKCVTLQKLN